MLNGRDLVSVHWLHEQLGAADLVVLDASIATTASGARSSLPDYCIREARYFDIKGAFTDKSNAFPNTLPSALQFREACRTLGINNSSQIVIYDKIGTFSSPRAWWLLKSMGHKQVAVLNGGLQDWLAAGFATEASSEKSFTVGDFDVNFDNGSIRRYEEVLANTTSTQHLLIDARAVGRFIGEDPEPRKNLQSGHISASINIPYQKVLDGSKFKSKEELRLLFDEYDFGNKELIFSCGSGMTACIVLFAAQQVLENKLTLYDGSWTEWATKQNLIIRDS